MPSEIWETAGEEITHDNSPNKYATSCNHQQLRENVHLYDVNVEQVLPIPLTTAVNVVFM